MNAPLANIVAPALRDAYPPFAAKMDEYQALANAGDNARAEQAFHEAQIMAQAFKAGANWLAGSK